LGAANSFRTDLILTGLQRIKTGFILTALQPGVTGVMNDQGNRLNGFRSSLLA